jgi:hypothetical protein
MGGSAGGVSGLMPAHIESATDHDVTLLPTELLSIDKAQIKLMA